MDAEKHWWSEISCYYYWRGLSNIRYHWFLALLIQDIYGADLLEDQNVAYVLEGITRKVVKEVGKANASQTLIGLLDMIA
jgi:hypothetical protein